MQHVDCKQELNLNRVLTHSGRPDLHFNCPSRNIKLRSSMAGLESMQIDKLSLQTRDQTTNNYYIDDLERELL